MRLEAGVGVMLPEAEECLERLAAPVAGREARADSPSEAPAQTAPADTWVSDFWLSELQENKFLL